MFSAALSKYFVYMGVVFMPFDMVIEAEIYAKIRSSVFTIPAFSALIANVDAITACFCYYTGLVGNLPGMEPNVRCGLWFGVIDGSKAMSSWNGNIPTDDCLDLEAILFCSRWGCPYTLNHAAQGPAPLALVFESDNL